MAKQKVSDLPVAASGHNSSKDALLQFIERIEKLSDERADISHDIRDVFAEAKGSGFDVKTMREMIKLRRLDSHELEEKEALRDAYIRGLDLIS